MVVLRNQLTENSMTDSMNRENDDEDAWKDPDLRAGQCTRSGEGLDDGGLGPGR